MTRHREETDRPQLARWRVFVDPEPMDVPWRPGVPVEVPLVRLDGPHLPDDLVLRDVDMEATPARHGAAARLGACCGAAAWWRI